MTILPAILDVMNLNVFFAVFSEKNKLQNFIGHYENNFYRKGEVVVTAGDRGECLFVIVEGEADIFYPGRELSVAVLKEGDIFGEIALLTDEPRSATVIAKTELRAMTLNKETFSEYMHQHPDRLMLLLKTLGVRMNNLIKGI